MLQSDLIAQTLLKAQEAARNVMLDPKMQKTISVATGLVGFNLQRPAKQLVPLMSPFYNSIPRKVKPGANSDNWRQITALSSPELFTAENAAGNPFTTTLSSKVASFKPSAIRGEVTRESQAASQGFDDALAKETANTLLVALKLMSQAYLYANITDIGAPAAPTVTEVSSTGGTLPADQYFVRIVALTGMAANRITLDVPGNYGEVDAGDALLAGRAVPAAGVNALQSTTALGGVGLSTISAEGNVTTTGGSDGIRITWAAVPGAAAYAVFVGLTTGAANLTCECVVPQTAVTLISLATGGVAGDDANTVPTADETGNAKHFDGILPQCLAAGSGSFLKNVNGILTGTAATAEVVEIQDAFASIYRTAKIGKFRVVMSGQDARSLAKKGILSSAMQVFAQTNAAGRVNMTIGAHVGEILNATTGDICPVEVEPWAIPGTIFILPMEIPFPMANAENPFEWVGNYDWERWNYSSTILTGPVFPFETRCNGALEGIFTGGCGVLYNVFQG